MTYEPGAKDQSKTDSCPCKVHDRQLELDPLFAKESARKTARKTTDSKIYLFAG